MLKWIRSLLAVLALLLGFTTLVEKLAAPLKAEKMEGHEVASSNGIVRNGDVVKPVKQKAVT